jgi:hypothetical protein
MRHVVLAGAALALAAGLALAETRPAYTPGPHNIALPTDWEERLVRYGTVDKPDRRIIRHLYVNREALAAARPGEPAPHGTLLVMADTRARLDAQGRPLLDAAGRFIPEPGWIAIAAQEKRPGWGEGYGPELRNGEWEYAAFTGVGERRTAPLAACFACHLQARAGQDHNFTFWDFMAERR